MRIVVGVMLRAIKHIEYADAGKLILKLGDRVIVETDHGIEEGKIYERAKEVEYVKGKFSKILRKLNDLDRQKIAANELRNVRARPAVLEMINKYRLEMKLIFIQYTFDRSKLFIYYTSESRVDFREFIKDLGKSLKTRIQMVQIGTRDEAKFVGGIGSCGQVLCCKNFLKEFVVVTMDMAKEQDLALNSSKLAGICGRLLCCIAYEKDFYHELKKDIPEIGSSVLTPEGEAKLVSINCILKKMTVDFGNKNFKTFNFSEIKFK